MELSSHKTMIFSREQRQAAYKKLSLEIQDFIMSNDTTELINDYLKKTSLSEEQSLTADSEILFAMLGLQTLSEAVSNIAKLVNKNVNDLSKLKTRLENNIFDKIKEMVVVTKPEKENVGFKTLNSSIATEPAGNNTPSTQNPMTAKKIRTEIKNKNKNNLPDELKNLPQIKLDMLFDGVWKERTDEIAKKYSLDPTQTDALINNVLFVLIGTTKIEVFLEIIITDLGISRLLAEQIIEDLEVRVFNFMARSIQNKEKRTTEAQVTKPQPPQVQQKTTPVTEIDIPEVRPEMLPMVEKGEVIRVVEKQKPTEPQQEKIMPQFSTPKPVTAIPTPIPEIKIAPKEPAPEPVQKPVSVPRYIGVPTEKEPPKPQTPMSNDQSNPNTKPPEPVTPSVKKYAVDPYREPLE